MAARHIDDHTLEILEFGQVLEILASFASSDLGREAARSLYPSTDPDWIELRLAQTSQLRDLLERHTRIPLAGIRDLRPLFDRLGRRQTVLEPSELLQVCQTLQAAARLKGFLLELDGNRFAQLRAMADGLADLGQLVHQIHQCVDADRRVKTTASVKLAAVRDLIAQLKAQVARRFEQLMADPDIRRALANERRVTRHGRPVLAVKAHYRTMVKGTVLDRSNTGATLYIEPEATVELSNQLEEALFEEKKEVNRILWELTHQVLAARGQIVDTLRTLGWIDLTYAKARFSIAYGMSCPQLARQPQARLVEARHPILVDVAARQHQIDLSQARDHVVPVSTRIGGDLDLLLVTGPNAGGKTVLLKTVGLCVLLAQSGCHIPAGPGSTVGVYRQVFADIGDQQSIQQNLSTFSAHIKQVIKIMARTGPGTLVLLDELGAGTDPQEGAALAVAILDELLGRSGHVVATTHMGRLKAYAFSRPRCENASLLFDTQTLQPTFRVLMGVPGSSNALAIAQRMGMPRQIVDQARALTDGQASQVADLVNEVQEVRRLAEDRMAEADRALAQARALRGELESQIQQLEQQRDLLRRQADLAIDQSLREVKELADRFAAAAVSAPKPWSDQAKALAEQIGQVFQASPLAARHMEFIKGLKRGDTVYMIPFRAMATVERVRYNRGLVVLLAGGKQIELDIQQICRPEVVRGL